MYVPAAFEETRVEVLHALMRAHPLATLVTQSEHGLNANHIPLQLEATPPACGVLVGHVARANPVVADLARGGELLALFHGPQAYVTPTWYATRQETGRVVPTWNYAVVHAYGVARLVDDRAWLRAKLDALTAEHEARSPAPWALAEAPADFTERLLGAIIGFELVITRLIGKWKMSQNQPPHNRAAVAQGLRAAGADAIAGLVEQAAKAPD